jgi:voltage-gated potassium channel
MIGKRIFYVVIALLAVVLIGTVGYRVLGGKEWSVLDSLYMTVITIASVGYGETHPLNDPGRIFTMFLIFAGCGVLIYAISTITAFVIEGELNVILRKRKIMKKIEQLTNHFIVCGVDFTGRFAVEELQKCGYDYVVVEKDAERADNLEKSGMLVICGDATRDNVLISAGIHNASGLITTLHSDAENLLVTFTAKRLNEKLRVISRTVEEENDMKLRQAGADGVVSPNRIGGLRMASELMRPAVVSFLDIMLRDTDKNIRVSEITISGGSPKIGQTIAESGLSSVEGAGLMAVKVAEKWIYNPAQTTVLQPDMVLIMVGDVRVIDELRKQTE